ncbi:hypothetical protein NITLEN_70154 [Nitrospira lenta]|uniref:Uncharacterized protein n=1 Tax=Nitrospira lenta TaxID=1436998 RepID=A0A330LB92_9BACT|nr:hypothetical protein NITLEN_70154 [Nitrospira lenta]
MPNQALRLGRGILNRRFLKIRRMLKTASSFVLGSSKSSTYPRGYASGFDSPAALLEDRFEHPVVTIVVAQLARGLELSILVAPKLRAER